MCLHDKYISNRKQKRTFVRISYCIFEKHVVRLIQGNFECVLLTSDWRVSRMDYKSKFIQMIESVNDNKALEYLHTFIKLFLDIWG